MRMEACLEMRPSLEGVSERQVANLIPGTNYNALLVAKNVDGTTSVGPIPFITTPGRELYLIIN